MPACRSRASSTAARIAVCRTRSNACPTRPISSRPIRNAGALAFTSTFSPRLSLPTTSGNPGFGELEGIALQATEAADDAARD